MKAKEFTGILCSISAALVLALGVCGVSAREPQKVDLYAIVAGVSKYKDSSLDLKLATKDATDFAEFIKSRSHLFNKVHTTLLTDAQATRANLARAIREDLLSAKKDDVVIIFLSGHGSSNPSMPDEYYFLTHDVEPDNMFGTALLMNDPKIYKAVKSDRVLLVADSCMSGGYLSGLERGRSGKGNDVFPLFNKASGRFGISAAGPTETAVELGKFGNGLFTFFLLKGLRGGATPAADGTITVASLFNYVAAETKRESKGKQNPQLYCAKGTAEETPVYVAPVYSKELSVKVQFFYEDEQAKKRPLADGAELKSLQHVALAFKSEENCFVHVLWWDSQGNVGRLFPNPNLSEGTGEVKAGTTYWLPIKKDTPMWYVLDKNPGYETIYFVASRERNPKLEQLFDELKKLAEAQKRGVKGKEIAAELEKEINLMGFAEYVEPSGVQTASFATQEELFQNMESKVKVAGADAFYKLRFKHLPEVAQYSAGAAKPDAAPAPAAAGNACLTGPDCYVFANEKSLVDFLKVLASGDKEAQKKLLKDLEEKEQFYVAKEGLKVHVLHTEKTAQNELPEGKSAVKAKFVYDDGPGKELWGLFSDFKCGADAAKPDAAPAPTAAGKACLTGPDCYVFANEKSLVDFLKVIASGDKEAQKKLRTEMKEKKQLLVVKEDLKISVLHTEDTAENELPNGKVATKAQFAFDGGPEGKFWVWLDDLKCGDEKGRGNLRKSLDNLLK